MKRGEIIAEMRGLKADISNVRGWLDAIEVRADRVMEALSQPAEQPRPEPVQPSEGGGSMPADDSYALSLADLVTPKQLAMIRALGREAGVDWELECQQRMKCKVEELSKRGASHFIDHLKGLQSADFRRAS